MPADRTGGQFESLLAAARNGDPGAQRALWHSPPLLQRTITAALSGDRMARNTLWLIASRRLAAAARALGIAAGDLPDLLQETIIAADRGLERFDPARGSLRTWLVSILAHRHANLRRRRGRRRRALARYVAGADRSGRERGGSPPGPFSGLDLERLLLRLPPRQQAVMRASLLLGLDARAAARILDLTPGGVRSIARDARRRLARLLEGNAGD